jgi:hypothetical protein
MSLSDRDFVRYGWQVSLKAPEGRIVIIKWVRGRDILPRPVETRAGRHPGVGTMWVLLG